MLHLSLKKQQVTGGKLPSCIPYLYHMQIFEHIICRHVLDHLEQHKILTDLQHGFRSGRSCETQLITTFQDIAEMYDKKGSQIDIAVLDFSKAFDTVPHDGLLSKLKHYGIDKHIWQWISNFLKKRKQCVVVDGVSSGLVDVDSGVPQGTVLGPILFLLHINDLPSIVSSKVRLFADDCLIYRQILVLVLVYTQEGSLWSIILRCDDHTGIFTCDGCARDPYFYVPAETQSYVIKLSCSRKVLAASVD